ncbi:MAG: histidine--tRNA ligase, partial [Anaerolineaceae bacterium]|nr:histidine--tRNA ligase [Anaerolineaceae bacterium]
VGQLYAFEDKGGRPVAIRPEFTQSLARMVVARQASLPKPIKWFNISRCCRYERAQKGRLREFFQWNCDILGAEGAVADAECILVAIEALRELGLTAQQVEVRLSSRKLMAAMLTSLGVGEQVIPKVYLALDKRGKAPPEVVDRLLDDLDIRPEQRKGIEAIFATTKLDDLPAIFKGEAAVVQPLDELRDIMRLVDAAGAGAFLRFDIGIVRGLAYYTGPVWEVFDRSGKLRSLFGGGRYDNLISASGGKAMPACGFGAGDVTMSLLLDSLGLWPEGDARTEFYVVCASADQMPQVVAVAGQLRQAGRSAEYGLSPAGLNRQMKTAASSGAAWAVIVGAEGCPAGRVRLRDMTSGQERDVAVGELVGL